MMKKIEEIKMTEIKEIDLGVQEGENLGPPRQGGGHPHHDEGLQAEERGREATLIHHDTRQKVLALLQFLTRQNQRYKNLNHHLK